MWFASLGTHVKGIGDKEKTVRMRNITSVRGRYVCEYKEGTEGETWTQCARVTRCKEEHTLTEHQSWGPSNESGLRMVNWESQSNTPIESGRRTHLLYFTCSYCILARVWKSVTLLLVLRQCKHLFLFLLWYCTWRHFGFASICWYLSLKLHTFSHTHTEAHTHKHTCMIGTQEEWRQPGKEPF